MKKERAYQTARTLYVLAFWLAVACVFAGCGTTSTKTKTEHGDNVWVSGYVGGISPKIGPYVGQARIEVTPGDSTSVRYTEETKTSVFNSASKDITRSFLFVTPSTNYVVDIERLMIDLYRINSSTNAPPE